MKMPALIVLVRHGESIGNKLYKDDLSSATMPNHLFPLTEKGKEQARRAAEYIGKTFGTFNAYFVSTFVRTRETMKILAPHVEHPIEDARLDEWWKGIWYSLGAVEIAFQYPHESTRKDKEGFFHYRPPGGESGQDVECRVRSFINDLQLNWSGERVLIVAHGRWLQFFRKVIENISFSQFQFDANVPNGSITVCRLDDWRVVIEAFGMLPK